MSDPKPAMSCSAARYHAPRPTRFVHHHVWPLGDDGPNVAANRVEVCDDCHYSTHQLLDLYRKGQATWLKRRRFPRGVQKLAAEGWRRIAARSL